MFSFHGPEDIWATDTFTVGTYVINIVKLRVHMAVLTIKNL